MENDKPPVSEETLEAIGEQAANDLKGTQDILKELSAMRKEADEEAAELNIGEEPGTSHEPEEAGTRLLTGRDDTALASPVTPESTTEVAEPLKPKKPHRTGKPVKQTTLSRVLDEQLQACYEAHSTEARNIGGERVGKDELGDIVTAWFKQKAKVGKPIGAKSDEELPFSLVVRSIEVEPSNEQVMALARGLGRKLGTSAKISHNFIGRYRVQQLGGYGLSPEQESEKYQVMLVHNSYEENTRGTVEKQQKDYEVANARNHILTVPSILDLIAAGFVQHELGQQLAPENTYGRDFTLPAKRVFGIVKCVPYFCVDRDLTVHLAHSPISRAQPIRFAKK